VTRCASKNLARLNIATNATDAASDFNPVKSDAAIYTHDMHTKNAASPDIKCKWNSVVERSPNTKKIAPSSYARAKFEFASAFVTLTLLNANGARAVLIPHVFIFTNPTTAQ
jgi:hypothetical protein